jgi:DNA-binding LacI/PurR family transcriptional regulator/DNA-binding transcriptional regulator YhcF (GntR family)
MKIDKENGLPKFFQLKEKISRDIVDGYYPVDAKLPTERSIMQTYKVSSITVARAMRELAEDGIVRRKVGDGTYVARIPSGGGYLSENTPKILLCAESKEISQFMDPCNWFVENEIRRGFVNACNHAVNFANFAELQERIEIEENIAVTLLNPSPDILKKAKQSNIKYTVIDQNSDLEPEAQIIKWNQLTGIYELISYLIKVNGHSRIGLIAGRSPYHNDRVAGYQIALHTFGVQLDESLIIKTDNGSDLGGYQAMEELLNLPERPTAVFVDTDLKAVGAINAIFKKGLRVPEDISIVGFDDMPGVDSLKPPLTTVKAPYFEMGSAAAQLLEKIIVNDGTPEKTEPLILETTLVIRESTARCSEAKLIEKADTEKKAVNS